MCTRGDPDIDCSHIAGGSASDTVELSNGALLPLVGIGTYDLKNEEALVTALEGGMGGCRVCLRDVKPRSAPWL